MTASDLRPKAVTAGIKPRSPLHCRSEVRPLFAPTNCNYCTSRWRLVLEEYVEERAALSLYFALDGVAITWEMQNSAYVRYGRGNYTGLCSRFADSYTLKIALQNPRNSVIDTIAHELAHVWQYVNKVLYVEYDYRRGRLQYWKGTEFAPARPPAKSWKYENSPEEVDARQRAREACRVLFGIEPREPFGAREKLSALVLAKRSKG